MLKMMVTMFLWGLSLCTQAFDFKDSHHLVFFFSSLCSHCQIEAPIVKAYAKIHQFQVEAYSLDGQGLASFSKPQIPSQDLMAAAFAGQSIQTPAIFIMNTKTLGLYPVAMGELDFDELSARVDALWAKIIEFERGLPS